MLNNYKLFHYKTHAILRSLFSSHFKRIIYVIITMPFSSSLVNVSCKYFRYHIIIFYQLSLSLFLFIWYVQACLIVYQLITVINQLLDVGMAVCTYHVLCIHSLFLSFYCYINFIYFYIYHLCMLN